MDIPEQEGRGTRTEIKREQIVRAARRLFIEQGYGATSMEAIRQAAGVSKPTLYTHFENKSALFVAVLGTIVETVGGTWLDAIESDTIPLERRDDVRTALLSITHHVIDGFMRPEFVAFVRVIIAEMGRFPDLGMVFRTNGPERALGDIATLLHRAHERGLLVVPDPHLAARLLMGPFLTFVMLNGILEAGEPQAPSSEQITLIVDMFMKSLS